ncbi:hypothetical protein P4056_14795 [Pseudomonas aeruginosa]|nr:hypothetical protein [Pseudomonas aeruginosa]
MQLFIAPFRTLFNGVTSGISAIALAWTGTLSLMVAGIEKVAEKIPAALVESASAVPSPASTTCSAA